MPRTDKITPHETVNNGVHCWRVIVPKAMNGGKPKRRFFGSKELAESFIASIDTERGEIARTLLSYSQSQQIAIIHAVNTVNGDVGALQRAADAWKARTVVSSKRIDKVVEEMMESKAAAGLRERSLKALASSLKMFQKVETPFLAKVTPKMIESWLGGGRPEIWSAATRRGYLTDVRTLYSFALKRGYVTSNPALAVDKPKVDKNPPGIHTVPQVEAMLRACLEGEGLELLPSIVLGYFGGLRPDEIKRLKRSAIGKDLIDVDVSTSKTRRRRFVQINETLRLWLKKCPNRIVAKNYDRKFDRVRELAAVPWPHDVLRHSFCSYGVPKYGASQIAQWAGHSEQVLFAHYRERVKPKDAEAFWAITPQTMAAKVKFG